MIKNDIVAVRVAGKFAEYYSPFYDDPYGTDPDYTEYYEDNILPIQPVIGPRLGYQEGEYISGDLTCLAERLACDCEGADKLDKWHYYSDKIADAVESVFESGEVSSPVIGNLQLFITPFRRGELPPVNEKSLEIYGKYASLIKKRIAAI